MKPLVLQRIPYCPWSRPCGGAWIETDWDNYAKLVCDGRALVGARGLKHLYRMEFETVHGSRPCGGAWIETQRVSAGCPKSRVAPLWGRVD